MSLQAPEYALAVNDSDPVLSTTLTDVTGTVVPLDQVTSLTCRLRPYGYTLPVINGVAAIDNATDGTVHYDPAPDLAALAARPGLWVVRWIAVFQSGRQMTFPDGGPAYLQVSA